MASESPTQQQQLRVEREAAYSERKYYARCLTSFSSDTLRAFLAHLQEIDPQTFAPRNGGESFHIDFNSLPEDTYALVRSFISSHLPPDPCKKENKSVVATTVERLVSTPAAPKARFINGARRFRTKVDQLFDVDGFEIKLLGTDTCTNRPYVCMSCEGAHFVSKNKCVDHIRYIHLNLPQIECEICHAKLKNRHYIKEHKQRVHGNNRPSPPPPSSMVAEKS